MRAVALTLVALVGLCLLGLWRFLPAREPAARAPSPDVRGDVLLVPGEAVIETRPAGAADPSRDALDPKRVAEAYSFEGRGRIRGHIGERGGAVFPLEWDLVLQPHPYLKGRERAESRRIPFRAGEREFEAEDLALGGYRVRAEAHGLNSSDAPVLLVKGSADQFVELAFSPSGWLDGSVIDAQGMPAEGLEVRLVGEAGKLERTTHTDGAGAFQFRALLDGDYELGLRAGGCVFGEPRLVSFRAPRLSLPVLELPPTGALEVHVFDLLGKPAPGARVTGFCKPAGTLDLRTDEQGRVRLRWIQPGLWELQALDEAEGLSARGEVEVDLSRESRLSLRLAR
jgi:Carboxypeptidase regulatory-like domain